MEIKQYYQKVMNGSVNMALATSVEDQPNVRVVTFGYDEAREGTVYFTTFKGNRKIQEFARNPQVACTPLPPGPEADAQVRIFGAVRKSTLTLKEVAGIIGPKAPDVAQTFQEGGDMLEVYEISFSEAWVTVGMSDAVCCAVDGN